MNYKKYKKLAASVIAILIAEPLKFYEIKEVLSSEEMLPDPFRLIFRDICQAVEKDQPFDLAILVSKAQGGAIKELNSLPRVEDAEKLKTYANELRSAYIRKKEIELHFSNITKLNSGEDVKKVLLEAEGFREAYEAPEAYKTLGEVGLEILNETIETKKGGKPPGVSTGFRKIDAITSGWQPSDQVIIAGRPGMGKTTYVVQTLLSAAESGTPVAFFSLEMSKKQLTRRMIAYYTGISYRDIQDGRVTDEELNLVYQVIEKIADLPIYVYDKIFDLPLIINKVRELKIKKKIVIFGVDYVQLVEAKGKDTRAQINNISRSFKKLAKQTETTGLLLSQLSRAVEQRGGAKRPMMSDLLESGKLEADADIIQFIYRPGYYNITEDESGNDISNLTEIIMPKHRNGATGTFKLYFKAPYVSFSEQEHTYEDKVKLLVKSSKDSDELPF